MNIGEKTENEKNKFNHLETLCIEINSLKRLILI